MMMMMMMMTTRKAMQLTDIVTFLFQPSLILSNFLKLLRKSRTLPVTTLELEFFHLSLFVGQAEVSADDAIPPLARPVMIERKGHQTGRSQEKSTDQRGG